MHDINFISRHGERRPVTPLTGLSPLSGQSDHGVLVEGI